jgi:hypothetical protein
MSSTVIPCLRYRDAPRMIEWLCSAFGFKRHLVVDDDQGGIAHAQLTLGSGMIMLGSARTGDDQFGRLQSSGSSRWDDSEPLPRSAGRGRNIPARESRRGRDRHRDQGRGLRRSRVLVLRSGRPPPEHRQLRSLEGIRINGKRATCAITCHATPPRSLQRTPRNGADAAKLRGCRRR